MKIDDFYEVVQIISGIADRELIFINKNKKVLAGNNGPYYCQDTNIRNTCHWIKIYNFLWKLTNEKKYLNAIELLSDYLIEKEHYGISGAIACMSGEKMDHLNGTIGQGWAIEGLITAYQCRRKKVFLDKAKQIYSSQAYNYNLHLWERVELGGKNIGPDIVFNHQLWFAANSSFLFRYAEDKNLKAPLDDFVHHIDELFDIYKEGLLKHYVSGFSNKNENRLKYKIRNFTSVLRIFDQRFDNKSFERGYHLFDLYGFALLYENYPYADVFRSIKFKKALSYGLDIKKLNKLINGESSLKYKWSKPNRYAYTYNSPAFEYPFVDYSFNNSINFMEYKKLWILQMKLTYNNQIAKFEKRTEDCETLTARLYELTYFLEKLI